MKLDTIETQPEIVAERFDLRPLRPSDAGRIEMYAGDPRVAMNTASIPHPLPPGATEAFVARANDPERSEDVWAMDATRSDGPDLMGIISLTRVADEQSEVSFWVAPAHWNSGVASTALEALLTVNPHRARTFFATVFQDNPASARVMTHCGFQYLGDAETFCVARNARVPTWTYSRKAD